MTLTTCKYAIIVHFQAVDFCEPYLTLDMIQMDLLRVQQTTAYYGYNVQFLDQGLHLCILCQP